jgi:hypothetical protein
MLKQDIQALLLNVQVQVEVLQTGAPCEKLQEIPGVCYFDKPLGILSLAPQRAQLRQRGRHFHDPAEVACRALEGKGGQMRYLFYQLYCRAAPNQSC